MKTHELKTWPIFFHQVKTDLKQFEIRIDDRGFQVGDFLMLREYNIDKKEYTGHTIMREISCIIEGGQFGIENGYCAMGLKHPEIEE